MNFRGFRKFIDSNNFMDATNVLEWVGRVLHTALNSFPQTRSGKFILPTQMGNFFVSTKSSGPAFTLHIERGKIHIDVDLVPCFIFDKENWPGHPFIKNPIPWKKPRFYVVSKKPKEVQGKATHYWVLNFQEQERELIKRRHCLKPAIKLIKKMRDLLGHDVMVSYFIKNVALWALEDINELPSSYSLSFMFMTILKKYRDFLEDEEIPYYWNKYFNMVKHVDSRTINTIFKKINQIINDIERNVNNNPMVVAKYLITRHEVNYLKNNYSF